MKNSILNGFKNTKTQTFGEILKGILDPSKIDKDKFDVFSTKQISSYLKDVLKENIGLSKSIQAQIVSSTKKELSHLVPVKIKKGDKIKNFFIVEKGVCAEILKSFEPVNKGEGYFDKEDENADFDEEEVLDFIKENNPDDDELIDEFGEDIIDYLNQLDEEGKISISDEGKYSVKEEDPTEDPKEDPTEDPVEDPKEDPTEDPKEEPKEDPKDEPTDNQSPEELEAMAKKTATATLINFYKNSNDENLKNIAAIELKTRGIDIQKEVGENNDNDPNLPDTKQELDELEKWIRDYLSEYDEEDLIKYVVSLINQSPAKRKALKEKYREYYSASNNGNKALKINDEDFDDFLENHYLKNFTNEDLKDMTFNLLRKNPKEYKKFKNLHLAQENIDD